MTLSNNIVKEWISGCLYELEGYCCPPNKINFVVNNGQVKITFDDSVPAPWKLIKIQKGKCR